MGKLFEELKRRKVFRVAAVYAVVAWVLIQVSSTILPTFEAPSWVNQTLIFLFILGFPIAVILAWAYETSSEGIKPDAQVRPAQPLQSTSAQPINYIILVIVLLAAGFQVADRLIVRQPSNVIPVSEAPTDLPISDLKLTRRFEINLGVTAPTSGGLRNAEVDLSPDGKRMVIGLQRPGSPQQIYVRELNQVQTRLISGADGGDHPFFSADGEWIVYTATNSLKKISILGGEPLPLADLTRRGGSGYWASDDMIYYASDDSSGRQLKRVSANGGEPETLQFDSEIQNNESSWPWLLPDGETVLFTLSNLNDVRSGEITAFSLTSGNVTTIVENGYNARYVPTGHIVFVRSASLWALPFDVERLEALGPAVPVIQGVQTAGNSGATAYTFSNDGLLVYLPGEDTTNFSDNDRTLVWVDRDGNEEPLPLRRDFRVPTVSPDGQRLAVVVRDNGNDDIGIYDLGRNTLSRLTFNDAVDYDPLWTPDGERVVFRSEREGGGLWWRAADGTGQAEPLITGNPNMFPETFTPDGSQLVYRLGGDLYLLNLEAESPPRQLTQSNYQERRAALSHDGQWIAYESNESGNGEIYVRPFPDLEAGKWQISNGGGFRPKWSQDDSELFFHNSASLGAALAVFSTRINTDSTFQYDTPRILFTGRFMSVSRIGTFDVSTYGTQFLLMRNEFSDQVTEQTRLVVIENWFEELKQLAPSRSQ